MFDVTLQTPTDMGWTPQTFTFVATGSSSTINFVSDMTTAAGGFAGAALDNVTVSQVLPVLIGVLATSQSDAVLIGRLDGALNTTVLLDVFTASSCSALLGPGALLPGPVSVATDAAG